MKKVQVNIQLSSDGDWWVHSPEAVGFFAYGDTREEALVNAKDALSIFLSLDENSFELEITETNTPSNGE